MGALLISVQLGWLTMSGQVAVDDKSSPHASAAEAQANAEDAELKQRLLEVTNKDPWHVGANIGMDLVRIPGNRPYKLLKDHWKEIAVDARKQILKGFTPGMMGNEEMHSQFFNVMHLGMSDKNAGVRSFAAGYLEMQGLPNFERDLAGYRRWRAKTEKLSAKETMKLASAIPEKPQTAEELTAKGWEQWKARKLSKAQVTFSAAVELDPKAVNAWNGLGWALFNNGQADEALPAFRQCIKLSPRHPAALNGLGQVYLSIGKYTPAEKYLKKAAPQAPAAWWGLTKIYLLTERFKPAEKWAEKVLAGSPDDPIAKHMLEDAKAGKLSEELRVLIEPVAVAEKAEAGEHDAVK